MMRMFTLTKLTEGIGAKYRKSCLAACEWGVENPSTLCWLFVTALVLGSAPEAFAQNSGTPLTACTQLLSYIEGGFASLVAAAAGLGAIVAAAVGGFKAAWALLVVSIGAFILRTYIGVFLAQC